MVILKKRYQHKWKKTQRHDRLFSLLCFIALLLLITSSLPTFSRPLNNEEIEKMNASTESLLTSNEPYFVWEDTFDNAQFIDTRHSNHYKITNGMAEMTGTYPQWTDPSWTKMKKITVETEEPKENTILQITVAYDNDMQPEYQDVRFKYNNDSIWLPYWIEESNADPNNPSAKIWVKLSQLNAGTNYLYLFYGNEDASDQSDYWSVFNENSWQKAYAHDEQITYHMASEGAWAPDVCFGEDRYLSSWVEGKPQYLPLGMIYQMQIRGCFYDVNGQQLGGRFDITPWSADPLESFRCEDPALAYGQSGGNTHFFVAYEYFSNPTDKSTTEIHGAILPRSTSSGDDVTRFTICDASGVQADPRVAFDSKHDQFFVVWEDGREGTSNYNVYGQLFDINGIPIGNEKIIASGPHCQCQPWITYDDVNNHFLIVWEDGIHAANGPFEIWGQLFDTSGNPIGSAKRLSHEGTTNTDYNYPSAAFSTAAQRFIIVWQEDDISSNNRYGHIWAMVLDDQANIVTSPFIINQGAFQRAKVVSYMSSSFFVAYDGGGEIWGSLVSSAGEVYSTDLQLSDTESSPADWVGLGTDGQQLFVTWEDLRIIYTDPYDSLNLPDIFGNIWSFNTPDGSSVSVEVGDEKNIVLHATIISVEISPENLEHWYEFSVVKTGEIIFDVLDGESLSVLKKDVSSGVFLTDLSADSIRLQASFQRENPSTSPSIDTWNVTYLGQDEQPPQTTIQDIEGTKGLGEWYISESVIVWLHAEDFPVGAGSGVDTIYYTLNEEDIQEYNQQSGLILSTSQTTNWMGQWDIVFWAKDNAGNQEDKNNPKNKFTISIDADKPYVEITSPANEEQVKVPFWVTASPTDNVGIDRVEFDIEPFGERDGLPYVDREPPYEWHCDVNQKGRLDPTTFLTGMLGTNVMVRAQVFDESGQSWTHEVWVHVTNWRSGGNFQNTVCLLYATGSGSVQRNGITLGDYMIGSVSWDFTSDSLVVAAGLNGYQTRTGPLYGTADLFFGYVSDTMVAGVAGGVSVTEL